MLTQRALERASETVYRHLQPTPTYAWPLLAEAIGCDVWVKHENHTPIGAFKVRGGLVYLDELERRGDARTLVTATRGNHGQSIPFAARLTGRDVEVFVPEGNSVEKNAAMEAWGARLFVQGSDFDQAREAAQQRAEDVDGHIVPSFSEHLVHGVATYGVELFNAVDALDRVYVPIGMGSGAASLIAVRDLLGSNAEVIGVVSSEADAMARSLEAGRIVETNSALTFADGMATRVPHEQAFEVLSRGLERIVRVTDDEIAEAIRLLYRTTHNVAEGAGAAATAALAQDVRNDRAAGRATNYRAATILTGGNIDRDWFTSVLDGTTPRP